MPTLISVRSHATHSESAKIMHQWSRLHERCTVASVHSGRQQCRQVDRLAREKQQHTPLRGLHQAVRPFTVSPSCTDRRHIHPPLSSPLLPALPALLAATERRRERGWGMRRDC